MSKPKTFSSKEMLRMECPAGHWFENVAPLGAKPRWRVVPIPTKEGKA